MSKKTHRSKDAARTPAPGTSAAPGTGPKDPALERAKRAARKAIAANIARIDAAEQAAAVAPSEQNGQPQQPQPDQQQPDQAREPAVSTPAPTPATAPAAQSEPPAPETKGAKRGKKTKDAPPAQPATPSPAKGGKKAAAAKKATKPAKAAKPAKEAKPKKLSCLDAAAQIIGKDPVGCADLIAEMAQRKLWTSPNGKTPEASLYAAIIREISAKKSEARFRKVDRGLFVKNG